MKIAIASDHAGFELKKELINYIKSKDHQILDFGTYSNDSVDYPDFAFPAAESVAALVADYGILICGTGIGMSIVANKVQGIRAALCVDEDYAKLARNHNNANVLCLGARKTAPELAKKIIDVFLEEDFFGDRHMIRVEKIHNLTRL
ncbi:MAG: ribose 5-phosphate isomerase B [Candidatus Kapaibacteriota bacterium]